MKVRKTGLFWMVTLLHIMTVLPAVSQVPHRITLSLNGRWDIEDSEGPDDIPKVYKHTVPVPGLAHSAEPGFPEVDQYETRQLLVNLSHQGRYPTAELARLGNIRGISQQKRNYFWYRTNFNAPRKNSVAVLKVNKAQFGIVVYLNGIRIGEHFPCFTAAYFDVTRAIHWNAPNELVIRVGAHPGVLPKNVSAGTDYEKNRWTPGIYDDVSLSTMDNPTISTVQVAPRLASNTILVQTTLHNYSDHPIATSVEQKVFEWKSGASSSQALRKTFRIPAGKTLTIDQTVPITKPHLWSPEDPFLYKVVTRTRGDDVTTRFGMREFRFDTATQRAYLNGRPYFLRGSNITLHRFFEDPDVGTLPWNDAWVHRLLVEIPKQLHWNSFRFCIGPVPDRWLEIADEAGLLIQNEYFVWTGLPGRGFDSPYDPTEMIGEYKEWMRDNWNHPSVAIWDATNESVLPEFTTKVIPAVRSLDLSNRPWENSYNAPAGPNDPVEDHEYLFYNRAMENTNGSKLFQMQDLESMLGLGINPRTSKTGHTLILNEYGWLWLNRDGSPTLLTQRLYSALLGNHQTAEDRFKMEAYLLGGETEYWRAYRRYAGVLQFVYLTASAPNAFTADNFLDVKTLKLEPHLFEAMKQAFNPLGVYLNFWQPTLQTGKPHDYTVAMVNDEDRDRGGKLRLVFVAPDGRESSPTEVSFFLPRLGAQSYTLDIVSPKQPAQYSLRAIAIPDDDKSEPTISRREVTLQTTQIAK